MQDFTNAEMLGLGKYITNELINMMHINIHYINIDNAISDIKFRLNRDMYQIIIWKEDVYYIEYKTYSTYKMCKPKIQLYEIQDFNDVFNVLEDIFDTLRPRDEY